MNSEPSDADLISLFSEGSDEAFRELVSRYKNYVFSIMAKQIGDRNIAEELSQDVFIKVYKGLKNFRNDSSFKTWLTRIILNTSSSYFRSKRYSQSSKTISIEELVDPEQGESYTDPLLGREAIKFFRFCFSKLSDELRDSISLFAFEERSYSEVSKLLNIPIGTVRSRLNRSRLTLRECMKRQGWEL